ncbi:uncharacterized protein LOC131948579 isoform X1 [Physella acuta]|uniref:uncharacterized protein LOC131948579 isoform X1 n=1 Tax=Physella acuta TaxID=109671 RepID=UPI0027DB0621|nr:uncharacterized protein LOC131948579 isoform X1 [Physella acuta]
MPRENKQKALFPDIQRNEKFNLESFEAFLEDLNAHKEHCNVIIKGLENKKSSEHEIFIELTQQFKIRQNKFHNSVNYLSTNIKALTNEIERNENNSNTGTPDLTKWDIELKKTELKNAETLKWLVQEEFQNEEHYKAKAIEEILSKCVHTYNKGENPGSGDS